jgi:hypothetical protein
MFKKVFLLLSLTLIFMASFCGKASAATEQDILNFLRQPFELNGEVQYIKNDYIVRAERFFSSHKYTPEQYDQILARLKEVLEVMKQAGVTDPTSMTWESEHRVLSLIYEGAEVANIEVKYGKGYLIFYEKDGTKIDEIYYTENNFKVTGLGDGVMLGTGLVFAAGGIFLWSYKRRLMA